ncbi:chromosome-associated protein H [Trypanosoma grayi]|uniref:chromosome-associated protein H n=1 Tax=Trypanosoma grayi TaxID=71804 RepID=UPI0004F47088|nr:chromosome-associated protein H [Trypanosoma grayi]KEG08238.1 chromosome-associated protein H [Trypanosoma grayi]
MEGGDDHDSNNNNNNIGGGVEDMPVEFFHGGAEADDDYMGAGGYDDYDYDNNDNIEDPVQQAQAHILSSFERAELARANNHNNNTVSSSSLLPLNGSGKTDFDALELAKVLHAPQAALPSQVDVVKLRQVMWASVGDAVARYPLTQQQQQHRQDEEQRSRRKRNRAEAEGNAAGESSEDLPRFSEVVLPILPQVASISATGTLSPAFLFFSILFLANEHGVMLESVPGLDDLVVRGVIQPVAG